MGEVRAGVSPGSLCSNDDWMAPRNQLPQSRTELPLVDCARLKFGRYRNIPHRNGSYARIVTQRSAAFIEERWWSASFLAAQFPYFDERRYAVFEIVFGHNCTSLEFAI